MPNDLVYTPRTCNWWRRSAGFAAPRGQDRRGEPPAFTRDLIQPHVVDPRGSVTARDTTVATTRSASYLRYPDTCVCQACTAVAFATLPEEWYGFLPWMP